jgi:hypothetical protein
MYVSFAVHLPEDGYMSDRNMWEVYSVYSTLSYAYVHMLVLMSYLIAQRTIMDHFKKLHPILISLLYAKRKRSAEKLMIMVIIIIIINPG